MKFRMILSALLLPAVVLAQQPGEKPKSAPPADTNARVDYSVIVPTNGQNAYHGNLLRGSTAPVQSNVRVNLNLRNARLKEAIKQLSKQTKQEFVLEDDAPADARVTVVAKNIRLNTALDMLTDATGLNWNQQTIKKSDSKETTVVFHLGKKISRDDFWQRSSVSPFINNVGPWNGQNSNFTPNFQFTPGTNNSNLKLDFAPALKGNLNLDTKPNFVSPDTGTFQNRATLLQSKPNNLPILQSEPYNLATNIRVGDTLLNSIGINEVRSTFTCPHCKNQVTVIHKPESPKCEKCGRVFHDDWQFCPFDGAKRPAGTDTDWQFCPICGERIKPDVKVETKPKGGKADTNNARSGN